MGGGGVGGCGGGVEVVGWHLPGLQVQGPHIVMHLLLLLLTFPPGSMPANHKEQCGVYGQLAAAARSWCSHGSCTSACPLVLFCVILPYIIEVPVASQKRSAAAAAQHAAYTAIKKHTHSAQLCWEIHWQVNCS